MSRRSAPASYLPTHRANAKVLPIRGTATIEAVDTVPRPSPSPPRPNPFAALSSQEFEAHVRSAYTQMAQISITPPWTGFYDLGTERILAFLRKLGTENHRE